MKLAKIIHSKTKTFSIICILFTKGKSEQDHVAAEKKKQVKVR